MTVVETHMAMQQLPMRILCGDNSPEPLDTKVASSDQQKDGQHESDEAVMYTHALLQGHNAQCEAEAVQAAGTDATFHCRITL